MWLGPQTDLVIRHETVVPIGFEQGERYYTLEMGSSSEVN